MSNELKSLNYQEEVKAISSREVAEMMEINRHADLIVKIEKINEVLENGKIRSQDYWTESTYTVEGNNKVYKEYQVTKKGCELLAHKSTGEKGIIFTVKYMERFAQMEQEIQQQIRLPQSPMDLLKLTYQALELHDEKIESIKTDVEEFKASIPLFSSECDEVSKTVKYVGTKVLGGKGSEAYQNKAIRSKVYSDIYQQLYREFGIKSHKSIKRCDLSTALLIVKGYKLPTYLIQEINYTNSQMSLL